MNSKMWEVSLVLFMCSIPAGYAAIYAECEDPKLQNTFVPSRSNCARYIYCDGEQSFEGTCIADNLYNAREGNCDDPENVLCPGDEIDEENPQEELEDLTREKDYDYEVDSSEGGNGWSNEPQREDTSPTELSIESATSAPPSATSFVVTKCSATVNVAYISDPSSCITYFLCFNGQAIAMICPRGFAFSQQLKKCEPQKSVVCESALQPINLQCRKGITDFLPHPDNCEYYYYCSNGFSLLNRCPTQYTWHYQLRSCVHRSLAKCYGNTRQHEKTLGLGRDRVR